MELDDISTASHGSRTRHFLKSMYGKTASSRDLTQQELDGAKNMADEEVLMEIHCMLRVLVTEKTGHVFYVPVEERSAKPE